MTVKGPYDFTGGWISNTTPYNCPDNAYVDAQNMEFVQDEFRKRKGNVLLTTSNHPGGTGDEVSVLNWFQNQFLVAACNGKVAYAASGTPGGWTDITGSTSPGGNWMASLNGYLMIGGASVAQCYWQGTGNLTQYPDSNSPHPPQSSQCGTVCNNYMFVGNGTKDSATSPERVWWSDVGDPTTWPSTQYIDVVPTGSDEVLAVFPFGQNLLIFKNNLIAMLYTQSSNGSLGPLVVVTTLFGIAGTNCVDLLPDGTIIFLASNNHLYIYNGTNFTDISDQPPYGSNIQSVLNGLGFGAAGLGEGCVKFYQAKNQVWVTYPFTYVNAQGTSYSLGAIFIFDWLKGIWLSSYPDHRIFFMVNYNDPTYGQQLVSAGISRLYKEDNGDANNDINRSYDFSSYVTKSVSIGSESRSYIPTSAFVGISCGSFVGLSNANGGGFLFGANGYNDPVTFWPVSFVPPASEHKVVRSLYTPAAGWNTIQMQWVGNYSNCPYALRPFYISDQMESQI